MSHRNQSRVTLQQPSTNRSEQSSLLRGSFCVCESISSEWNAKHCNQCRQLRGWKLVGWATFCFLKHPMILCLCNNNSCFGSFRTKSNANPVFINEINNTTDWSWSQSTINGYLSCEWVLMVDCGECHLHSGHRLTMTNQCVIEC